MLSFVTRNKPSIFVALPLENRLRLFMVLGCSVTLNSQEGKYLVPQKWKVSKIDKSSVNAYSSRATPRLTNSLPRDVKGWSSSQTLSVLFAWDTGGGHSLGHSYLIFSWVSILTKLFILRTEFNLRKITWIILLLSTGIGRLLFGSNLVMLSIELHPHLHLSFYFVLF